MTITTRQGKGAALTHNELDGNFTDLDTRTKIGWRDNIVPIYADLSLANAPTLDPFLNNIKAYAFAANEVTEAYAVWHIDHDYLLGSALYPHVHWAITTTNTGTVRWGVEYTIAKGHGQGAFTTATTVYIEQASDGTARKHYVAEVTEGNTIPGTNIEPDTIIMARLFRDGTHVNDTLEVPVFGLCLDLHYQCDKAATPNKVPNFYV